MIDPSHEWNVNFKPVVIGFLVSIFLILSVFFLTIKTDIRGGALLVVVLGLGIVQAAIQLVFFFHLGLEPKPRWNLMTFFFMVMVIILIIGGSMWIMHNIEYNLMPMP